MTSYCLKCKDDTKNIKPKFVMTGGRYYLKSLCQDCNAKKSRALPKSSLEGKGIKNKALDYYDAKKGNLTPESAETDDDEPESSIGNLTPETAEEEDEEEDDESEEESDEEEEYYEDDDLIED